MSISSRNFNKQISKNIFILLKPCHWSTKVKNSLLLNIFQIRVPVVSPHRKYASAKMSAELERSISCGISTQVLQAEIVSYHLMGHGSLQDQVVQRYDIIFGELSLCRESPSVLREKSLSQGLFRQVQSGLSYFKTDFRKNKLNETKYL